MNSSAHKAISTRWAASANDTAAATMPKSIQKLDPAWPSRLSWRTTLTAAITASAWMRIVHRTALVPTAKGLRTAIRIGGNGSDPAFRPCPGRRPKLSLVEHDVLVEGLAPGSRE